MRSDGLTLAGRPSTRQRATRQASQDVCRQPAPQGVGLVNGSTERLRGPTDASLPGEVSAKGREARGAAERGHG